MAGKDDFREIVMDMEAKSYRRQSIGVVLVLLLLAVVPHWRSVVLGELALPEGYLALIAPELKGHLRQTPWNALWWDGIGQFWAWRTEAMRQIYYGRIPLWTNRVGCGFPFLANPQTQSLYPLTLLGNWAVNRLSKPLPISLRSARLMTWIALFHTLLALVGTYLLIRSYGISRLSSLVGAAAYGLGSFQIAWVLLPTLPATAAWLPLTIWLLRKLVAAAADANLKTAIGFGIGFSLSLAMMLLAGHGQIAVYSLLALLLFSLLEIIPIYRKVKFAAFFAVALPFLFSFLLAAAQLLPTMELAPLTHRHGAPTWEGYRAFAQRGLTISDWATMALPFLFGNPIDGSYFGKESFADYCAYAGFGVLVLAILGAMWLFRNLLHSISQKRLSVSTLAPLHALLLFLLGALLASGSTFNLPLYFLLPGFSQLGTPSRAVFLCQLALGLMAAWVLETAWSKSQEMSKAERGLLAVGAVVLAFGTIAIAVGYVGWWLSINLPDFSWSGWTSLLTEQNIGIVAGLFAVLILSLRHFPLSSLQSPLFRYGVAVLLIGELSWFAAQQIPTARPSVVQQALQIAEQHLIEIVKSLPTPRRPFPVPRRLLIIGSDWSLVRYPQSLLPPNSVLLLPSAQVADARNYDSLLLRQHKSVMAVFSNGNPCPLENGNLILMPAKQISSQDARKLAQTVGADAVVEAFSEQLRIAEIVSAKLERWEIVKIPRAFVPTKVQYVQTVNEALNQIRGYPVDTALLIANPQKHQPLLGAHALVTLDKDAFIRVWVEALEIPRLRSPVWLVLSDTAYPGWRAFIPLGYSRWQQLPISIANGAFRACYLPDAFSGVIWVYFPSSFAIGLFLSCVGIFCIAGIGVIVLLDLFAKLPRKSQN